VSHRPGTHNPDGFDFHQLSTLAPRHQGTKYCIPVEN